MTGFIAYPKRHLRKLANKGEYSEALQYGKSIESKFSKDADFHFIMGGIYYILEESKKAIDYFDKGLAIDSTDIEALMLKTNSHLALNEKDMAIECCKNIISIDSSHKEAQSLLDNLESLN